MKFVHVLIGKSIAETILVAALAVAFYFTAFPPYFHGWGEATPHAISGWVVNQQAPSERVAVQLFIDGKFVATDTANRSRLDVVAAGWSRDEWHGYAFVVPPLVSGIHEARVYALHVSGHGVRQTLQLIGDTIPLWVDGQGTLHNLKKEALTR